MLKGDDVLLMGLGTLIHLEMHKMLMQIGRGVINSEMGPVLVMWCTSFQRETR